MKAAASWLSAKFMVGLLLYGLGAIVWLIILRLYPLSVAFPVASDALMVGTTLAAFSLLKEPVSMTHILGITLIISGIVILSTKLP
jgi:undecaprenyl phosphate-alpha-L-ara4N flippase subunit ArnE